jgi:hypothetical protein
VSDHTFKSRVSEQEHVVVYLVVNRLLIDVVFTVLRIARFLEGKSLHTHVGSIDDDSFVKGLRRNHIFHSSDELELVFVELLDVADSGGAVGRFLVVFLEKSADYFRELAVLVNMLQMHGRLFLERLRRLAKH